MDNLSLTKGKSVIFSNKQLQRILESSFGVHLSNPLVWKELGKENIDEGLIQTYPINKAIEFLCDRYQAPKEYIQIKQSSVPSQFKNKRLGTEDSSFILYVKNDLFTDSNGNINNDKIKQFMKSLDMLGYFISLDFNSEDVPGYHVVGIEPKWQADLKDFNKIEPTIVHLTLTKNVPRITKQGIVPRSSNYLLAFPDRVYFTSYELGIGQWKFVRNQLRQNLLETFPNSTVEDFPYSIVFVETGKIPNNPRFYEDLNFPGCFYTYDNIPPSAILSIRVFND